MTNKAIIVGIQGYPGLPPPLQGPRNDAKKFLEWVTRGGGVAPGDAKLILDEDPPAPSAAIATPTKEAVERELDLLEEEAMKSHPGRPEGRLYLYLSGHGFGQSLNDACLLMANATRSRTWHNISGRPFADRFYASGLFEEVVMFLDCCRERYAAAPPHGPAPVSAIPPRGARRFYGFAAKFGKLAVERMIHGQMGGVFTATLLDALNGGASEEDGRITGESLKAYLYENMKNYLSPTDLLDREVAQEPELFCDPPERQFVIANAPPRMYDVAIPLPPAASGNALQLFGEKGGQKFTRIAQATAALAPAWKLSLLRGSYQLLVGNAAFIVTVQGGGVTDVVPA